MIGDRPHPLWGSRALCSWVQDGGVPERPSALLGRGRAALFDLLLRLQQSLPDSGARRRDPVFLIGPWRTGSTLLHSLLAQVPGLQAPTTWQCFHPASCRLVPAARTGGMAVRPMDGMVVSGESPQEDEFALLLLGTPSLYRAFLDPRRMDELLPLLEGADGHSFARPLAGFLAAIAGPEPQRPLLKSPNHLFRLPAIRTAFPGARFVATLRDPAETYWSNRRMWTDMTELYGLWRAPEGVIADFLPRMISAAADRLGELAAIDGVVSLRFEALARDPAAVALRTAAALGEAPDAEVSARLEQVAGALRHSSRTARNAVPPEAVAACRRLAEAQEALLAAG